MKKVGILTYHFAINYGAALQCYALKRVIEKLGYDVSIINLITDEQEKNNSTKYDTRSIKGMIKSLVLLLFNKSRKIKKEKFANFTNMYFEYTPKCTNAYGLQEVINRSNISVVVCGSDQVWNNHVADFTELFFLPDIYNVKKIGYAVSIGTATSGDLKNYAEYIKDYECIGVREESSIPVIKKVYDGEPYNVCDPCLLLDREQWEQLDNMKGCKEKYIICYFLKKEKFKEMFSIARKFEKKYKMKVYFINQRYGLWSLNKNSFNDVGVEDFISLFLHSEKVITDSFHGTVFSLIFEKDFYSICSNNNGDRRKQDLLRYCGLDRRIIYLENMNVDEEEIDYANIRKLLSNIRNSSVNFLSDSLR